MIRDEISPSNIHFYNYGTPLALLNSSWPGECIGVETTEAISVTIFIQQPPLYM